MHREEKKIKQDTDSLGRILYFGLRTLMACRNGRAEFKTEMRPGSPNAIHANRQASKSMRGGSSFKACSVTDRFRPTRRLCQRRRVNLIVLVFASHEKHGAGKAGGTFTINGGPRLCCRSVRANLDSNCRIWSEGFPEKKTFQMLFLLKHPINCRPFHVCREPLQDSCWPGWSDCRYIDGWPKLIEASPVDTLFPSA
ncbi:hypothetical protein BDW66DRAFT_44298 [Aspergillus desertorum]